MSRAFEYYAGAADVSLAVEVAEHPFPPAAGHVAGVAQLINRALELVPPDSHEAGRLLSTYVRVVGVEAGNYEGAQEAFERALEIAQHEGNDDLELRTMVNAAVVDTYNVR